MNLIPELKCSRMPGLKLMQKVWRLDVKMDLKWVVRKDEQKDEQKDELRDEQKDEQKDELRDEQKLYGRCWLQGFLWK